MASAALAGTLALSSAALGDSDFLSSEDWEDLDSHSSGVLADSDGLSSALGDSGSPSSGALEDLDGLSTGALAVTGRPFLADTAATVDSVTHGTRKWVACSSVPEGLSKNRVRTKPLSGNQIQNSFPSKRLLEFLSC